MAENRDIGHDSAFDLTGRRVLVTGAAGGIGASAARTCALQGAAVDLVDIEPPDTTAAEIGAAARAHVCDISDRAAVEAFVEAVGPVDALVSSAAICPWDDWTDADWDATFDRVMSVNVQGPIHLARALLPGMIDRRWGRMVFVGSVAGRMGGLIASAHYAASKGGLHTLVRWLAQRGAPHNVMVNGVAPANTDTSMISGQPVDLAKVPARRLADPSEVAWPIAFLCSEAASYISGAVLDVNGGIYVS